MFCFFRFYGDYVLVERVFGGEFVYLLEGRYFRCERGEDVGEVDKFI